MMKLWMLPAFAVVWCQSWAPAQRPSNITETTSTFTSRGQTSETSSASQIQIKQRINELLRATGRKDEKTVEAVLDDDFTYTDLKGAVLSKSQYLRVVLESDVLIPESEVTKVSVRFYGQVALANSEVRFEGTTIGLNAYRQTDVLVRTKGQWRFVSTQVTRIER
jgi:hypothetical protein